MIATLLVTLAIAGVPVAQDSLVSRAGARLSACTEETCPAAPTTSPFRIDANDANGPTAKDRAMGAERSTCTVVGARACTRPPRTLLRTSLDGSGSIER